MRIDQGLSHHRIAWVSEGLKSSCVLKSDERSSAKHICKRCLGRVQAKAAIGRHSNESAASASA